MPEKIILETFEQYLRCTNLSENTIMSYLSAMRQYNLRYDRITRKNLHLSIGAAAYKMENSVNFL